jgi:tetratricopeptide (TPR) repeat protein
MKASAPLLRFIPFACLVFWLAIFSGCSPKGEDAFTQLMTRGNGFLEAGNATNAFDAYSAAVKLAPTNPDARLNLANACLLADDETNVIAQCRQVLGLDHNNAAAFYLMGCAYLRLNQPEPAVQALQQSERIDPAITALHFQLGLAQARLGQLADAIAQFETVVKFDPENLSAHYQLAQLYQRADRADDATRELKIHQQLLAKHPNAASGPATFERCKYTQPRIAFRLEQPDEHGVAVHFVDATSGAFSQPANFHGPMAVLDYIHDGRNSLFAMDGKTGFRLLNNQGGHFEPIGDILPGKTGAIYQRCLVGDLDNDRFEDVVVLGEQASHAYKFASNGRCREVTALAGFKNLKARDGVLADLDFTGKLDLLTVLPDGSGLRVYQNLGSFYFKDSGTNSGLPATLPGAEHLAVEDWNNADVPGVFVSRKGQPPAFFSKQRAGSFVATNSPADWPAGSVIAVGDLNNDLRADLVVAGDHDLTIIFGGLNERLRLPLNGFKVRGILLTDFDNDGWLDVIIYGNGLRVWRNLGKAGFADVTTALGLDKVGDVDALVAADFDNDGDTDLILSTTNGLQFLRNDGGNANRQLKLRLIGNRSNASALGVRAELTAGNWRTIRTLRQLPLEIGTGQHDKLDSLKIRWFDLASSLVDVPIQTNVLTIDELKLPAGSCPYLYAWDGQKFKFVTDILGAAPLGLPVSQTHFIEADPEEFLALGDEQRFPPKDNAYEIRLTEELREVLYLDEASLVVVDHPAGTLVCPTSKLRASKPFPPAELWILHPLAALKQATRSDGLDVTELLTKADNQMVAPVKLREPQLRGLAEPFFVTLDFGPLPGNQPLVLVLNGWLRFGGGMANVAASLDPKLPFPFPMLEAELPDGSWKKLEVDVGAPCGKTKTILVDLAGKLPPGSRRFRLTTAFEIYWDSAELCERVAADQNKQYTLSPDHADLHWRGFSEFLPLPDCLPLTPDYEKIQSTPPWRRTPSGWCTRYGEVNELVQKSDDALVLLNGGDELSLAFPAGKLPPKPAGMVRDFFLHAVGWDKDADFHVGQGWLVEPLPFHGMDDQAYGHQIRPPNLKDDWIQKYNTRWVGPLVLDVSKSH